MIHTFPGWWSPDHCLTSSRRWTDDFLCFNETLHRCFSTILWVFLSSIVWLAKKELLRIPCPTNSTGSRSWRSQDILDSLGVFCIYPGFCWIRYINGEKINRLTVCSKTSLAGIWSIIGSENVSLSQSLIRCVETMITHLALSTLSTKELFEHVLNTRQSSLTHIRCLSALSHLSRLHTAPACRYTDRVILIVYLSQQIVSVLVIHLTRICPHLLSAVVLKNFNLFQNNLSCYSLVHYS